MTDEKKKDSKHGLESKSFSQEFKLSLSQIKHAVSMPEVYLTISYHILAALFQPKFMSYWYYFKMNVVKFSKFEYAIINCISYFYKVLGSICYNKYFREYETRRLIMFSIFLNIFQAVANLLWVKRVNIDYGISDRVFVIATDILVSTLTLSFRMLPMNVHFAKITPSHIEGTCFAFYTGTTSFLHGVLATYNGSLINDAFIGVTSSDLSNFTQLA